MSLNDDICKKKGMIRASSMEAEVVTTCAPSSVMVNVAHWDIVQIHVTCFPKQVRAGPQCVFRFSLS
jgi:hypothetical protein